MPLVSSIRPSSRSFALFATLLVAVAAVAGSATPATAQSDAPFELDVPFEDVAVDGVTGQPLRLFIQNPQPDSTATFDSYELSGPDADEFVVLGLDDPVTVQGASFHAFAVELRPTSPGPKSADLFVTSSGRDLLFTLHGVAAPADAFEPNDGLDSPSSMPASGVVEAVIEGDDADVFAFDAVDGETVVVAVENRGTQPMMYLVGGQESGLYQAPTEIPPGGSETFDFDVPTTGTYVVATGAVFAERGIETGQVYLVTVPYTVTVEGANGGAGGAGVNSDTDTAATDGATPAGGDTTPAATAGTGSGTGGDGASGATPTETTGSGSGFGIGVALLAAAVASLLRFRR